MSKIQKWVSLPNKKAEYIVDIEASTRCCGWSGSRIRYETKELHRVYYDNQSANLSMSAMYHAKIKHMYEIYHLVKKAIEEQLFQTRKIHKDKNNIYMMTNVVTKEKLVRYIKKMARALTRELGKLPTSDALV